MKTDQMRSIDKRRIVKRIGGLDAESVIRIERALQIHLDLAIEIY